MYKLIACTVALPVALVMASAQAQQEKRAWEPSPTCKLSSNSPDSLYASALAALKRVSADARVTQAMNPSKDLANYHGMDMLEEGREKTAAVDLSVRCMTEQDIREFLSALTDEGFVAWYRKPGVDDWTQKAPHIHAVWVNAPLKPQLRKQVGDWLAGRTGMVGHRPYKFWQPSVDQKASIARLNEEAIKLDRR